jgi:hypothetical protein
MFTTDQLKPAAAVTAQIHSSFVSRTATRPGDQVTVPLTWGQQRVLHAGVVDDSALYAFTTGQCHALAFALCLVTGFTLAYAGPVECVYDTDCDQTPSEDWCGCQVHHLGVVSPDGFWLDIHGAVRLAAPDTHGRTPSPMGDDEYGQMQVLHVASVDVLNWVLAGGSWRYPDVSVALSFTDAILAQYHQVQHT